jgi:hypothetical protein
MQLDAQCFIRLVETNKSLAIWDLETQGLNADYGGVLCGSIKVVNGPISTFQVAQLGNDKRLVRELKEHLESFDAWVTQYGKMFDVKFLNTRLLRHGLQPLDPRPHIDTYFVNKTHLKLSSRSQAQLLSFLGTDQQKYFLGPENWAELGCDFKERMKEIVKRCESDVAGLEQGYHRIKHIIRDIRR